MKKLCVLSGEKICVPFERYERAILFGLNEAEIPWYIYEDTTNKLWEKANCSKEKIVDAKQNPIAVEAHKTVYVIMLRWWAGSRVVAEYSSREEAYKHLSTRCKTYQGNGYLTCEEHKVTKDIKLTEDILTKILSSHDSIHNKIIFKHI